MLALATGFVIATMVFTIDDPSMQEIYTHIEDGGTFESEAFVSFQSKLGFDANDVLEGI